ncbi:AEC family transporter [Gryllotalpicola ginsengisoli]|uniref:AEC family transporter n=1 Tax=Gryllotalpicola ginsengisoli TaxID=444608 RepID=UPI0003B4B9AA|nr:AEC family transporter [Gryllotalpicola ginsengisoli]
MAGVFEGFAIIAFVIAVGYVVGRAGVGGPHTGYVLNRIAFFVTNPALLFTVLAKEDISVVFSGAGLATNLAAVGAAAVFLIASRVFFPRPAARTTIGVLASSYSNFNNIGIPVAAYVLGSASYVAPALLVQLIVFAPIALTTLDVTSRGRVSVRDILLNPVRNPMIIASVAGVVIAAIGWQLPKPVDSAFTLLGGAAVPLVLMAFGMSLHGAAPLRETDARAEVLLAAGLKNVLMPLLAYLIARFGLGIGGHELFVTVVLAALPAAQNVYNFAARYERGEIVARDAVLLTTVLSVPAIVVIALLLA